MSRIEKFEDLIAWQKARGLTRAVYEITRHGEFGRDYGLAGQMQRAAVSIMSNIAEGFERGSAADYHRFLVMAKSSCAELRSQFYIALDAGYIDQEQFSMLTGQAVEVSNVLGGLRASIAKQIKAG